MCPSQVRVPAVPWDLHLLKLSQCRLQAKYVRQWLCLSINSLSTETTIHVFKEATSRYLLLKKSLNVSSDQLDSKKKTPNFVTETFSCRLLQRMVRMDMDWKKKTGPAFPGVTECCACQNRQKIIMPPNPEKGIYWMFARPTVTETLQKTDKTFLNCFRNCFKIVRKCFKLF